MSSLIELSQDCYTGGSIGADRRFRPTKIFAACDKCGTFQPFNTSPHGQRIDQPLFSSASKCARCGRFARFVLTYPDDSNSADRIEPDYIGQLVGASYIGFSAGLEDQERKIRARLKAEDYGGAIAACFTFVEQFLKIQLIKLEVNDVSPNEGNLRKLFKFYLRATKLDGSDEKQSAIKPLVTGLSSVIAGLYEVGNKLSDRHVAKAEIGSAEAVLTIKCTLSLCEYLTDRDRRSRQD